MTPQYIKFSAFGPYVEEQIIDFSLFDGLFLICGETGAGKTVILDAITYALYGKSSGGGRDGMEDMRCQLAPTDAKTYVEYVFSVGTAIYKFTRSLRVVNKRSGGCEYKREQNALRQNRDGIFEPFFENPLEKRVNEKAAEIIGLTYAQFCQVVILPQGQFERLLVAKSDEKENILVSLFNADRWKKIAEHLTDYLNGEKRRLETDRAYIERTLEENGCESAEQLSFLFSASQAELAKINVLRTDAERLLALVKKEYDEKNALHRLYSEHDELFCRLCEHERRKPEIQAVRTLLDASKRAAEIKPIYDNMLTADIRLAARERAAKSEAEKLEQLNIILVGAQAEVLRLENIVSEHEKDKLRLVRLAAMTEAYEKIDAARQKLADAKNACASAEKASVQQKELLDRLTEQKSRTEKNQAAVYEEYLYMFKHASIIGRLAAELCDGKPCPVCGSLIHPDIAQLGENDITEAMLEQKRAEIEKIADSLRNIAVKTEECSVGYTRLAGELTERLAQNEKAHAEFELLKQSADSEIPDAKTLKQTLAALREKIKAYETSMATARERSEQAKISFSAANTAAELAEAERKSAAEEYRLARNAFISALSDSGFSDEDEFKKNLLDEDELNKALKAVNDYEVAEASLKDNITKTEKKIGGREMPDLKAASEKLAEAEKTNVELAKKTALAESEAKRLQTLTERFGTFAAGFAQAEEKFRENQQFILLIRGDSGISLERYVLGVMLSSVTAEANKLLANVHGGRYRLYRTVEATGGKKKAGLELEVYDSFSDERRSVVSLSGGEKFLTSLALSIGLSSVVQAQSGGVRLDAMFIDEGFGSLDAASVDDALAVLASVGKNNGPVGIISHVSALRETISAGITVTKGKNGSMLHIMQS